MIHYNSEQLASFPWIISSGTLRAEDLLPACWSALETVHVLAGVPSPLTSDELWQLKRLVGEDSSEADWSDDEASELLDALFDRLQDFAPAGCYFGANESDGACFGFWLTEEWADALAERGLESEEPEIAAQLVQIFEDDYGLTPDTLADGLAGEADGWSEEKAGASWCQEFADDCGLIPDGLAWPLTCIDWEEAWAELCSDGYGAVRNPGPGADYLILRPV